MLVFSDKDENSRMPSHTEQSLTSPICLSLVGPKRTIWGVTLFAACVASVSVWFQSKERPRDRIFGFGRPRNGTRAKKWKRGREERKQRFFTFLPHPLRALLLAPFFARFRSSFFAPKPHGNACYAGYIVWYVILICDSWNTSPTLILATKKAFSREMLQLRCSLFY